MNRSSTPAGPDDLSPLTASLWAEAMARYWEPVDKARCAGPAAPLQLLDVLPRGAGAVRLLLRELSARVADAGRLRYFACTEDGALPDGWRDAPELSSWIEQGVLAPLHWPSVCRGEGWQPGVAFVAMARHCLGRLEQRLLAVHYGQWMEADLDRLGRPREDAGDAWRPMSGRPWGASLDTAVEACRARLNSAPVPLPIGAMHAVDRLAGCARAGFLWLAVDHGLSSEQAMRRSRFDEVESRYRETLRLPVNFHLLEAHMRGAGAAAWQRDVGDGRVIQVAVKLATGADARQTLRHVIAPLERAPALDTRALAHAMRTVIAHGDADQALLLLRLADHDPAVFAGAGPALHRKLLAQPGCDRAAWAEALTRVWDQHLPAADARPLARQLASAALCIEAWALARRVLLRTIALHGRQAAELAQLAWCDMNTGRPAGARDLVTQALARSPRLAHASDLARRLDARARRWEDAGRRCLAHPEGLLALEPLDAEHAPGLLHQYRDPQIAVMASLPALGDLDAMRRWVDRMAAAPSRHACAVVHRDAGPVGYVGLRTTLSAADFCFWIGTDHQGRGFAAAAGRLLCDFAWTQGIGWIFATAFSDNARSIRALTRIGFGRLPLRVVGDADPRTFMVRAGPNADAANAVAAFSAHLRRCNGTLRLAPEDGDAPTLPSTADASPR